MIFILILHPQKSLICSRRHHLFMHITQDHPRNIICTSAVPIFGSKLWNEIPGRMRDMSKKVFKRKLISVLFGILKDNDDYLDATMITREIKSRNSEPKLLSQLALNRFVLLAFDFITHSLLFFFFAVYL